MQLKNFAKAHLRGCPFLHELILEEPDAMSAQEFVVKTKVWLQVLRKEIHASESRGFRHPKDRPLVRQ